MRTEQKHKLAQRRHWRVRGKISGTRQCPRMSVCFTNENIHVQFIDDDRLGVALVKSFLIIGIVAAVRHILVTGASLSIAEADITKRHRSNSPFIHELYANIGVIAVCVLGLWVVGHLPAVEPTESTYNMEAATE